MTDLVKNLRDNEEICGSLHMTPVSVMRKYPRALRHCFKDWGCLKSSSSWFSLKTCQRSNCILITDTVHLRSDASAELSPASTSSQFHERNLWNEESLLRCSPSTFGFHNHQSQISLVTWNCIPSKNQNLTASLYAERVPSIKGPEYKCSIPTEITTAHKPGLRTAAKVSQYFRGSWTHNALISCFNLYSPPGLY